MALTQRAAQAMISLEFKHRARTWQWGVLPIETRPYELHYSLTIPRPWKPSYRWRKACSTDRWLTSLILPFYEGDDSKVSYLVLTCEIRWIRRNRRAKAEGHLSDAVSSRIVGTSLSSSYKTNFDHLFFDKNKRWFDTFHWWNRIDQYNNESTGGDIYTTSAGMNVSKEIAIFQFPSTLLSGRFHSPWRVEWECLMIGSRRRLRLEMTTCPCVRSETALKKNKFFSLIKCRSVEIGSLYVYRLMFHVDKQCSHYWNNMGTTLATIW